AAPVRLRHQVHVAFVGNFGRAFVLFAKNLACFLGSFNGNFKIVVGHDLRCRSPRLGTSTVTVPEFSVNRGSANAEAVWSPQPAVPRAHGPSKKSSLYLPRAIFGQGVVPEYDKKAWGRAAVALRVLHRGSPGRCPAPCRGAGVFSVRSERAPARVFAT